MDKTTKVLDHGYVKFIDSMGDDEVIVEAARMSTGKGFITWEPYSRCESCGLWVESADPKELEGTKHKEDCKKEDVKFFPQGDSGLLDNLWRNKHATPFEMGELCLEIQAPIMVFREWHRHRTQSYNEFSARYAQMPDLHYLPEAGRIQKQSVHNKQGSAEAVADDFSAQILAELERQQDDVYGTYDAWVGNGVAKEVARLNTPVSRYSKMRAKTDLRNWLAFCNLRMRPGAQWEIRQYANIVGDIIKSVWPKTWALFEEYDLYGASFSRTEMKLLRLALSAPGMIGEETAEKMLGSKSKAAEFIKKVELGGTKIL